MGLFSDMLASGESLFKNEVALDYDYLPKIMPYREKEQQYLAQCIKPLLMRHNGKNLLIHGAPGIGKTAATKWVLRDLEEETDEVIPIYVNCWHLNTSFKIFTRICEELDFKFIQNKKTDELFKLVRDKVNKSSAVFIFDEIDKVEDYDFLYMILEEIYRKSIFLITNYKDLILSLDERIRSRLTPELVEFKQYNESETKGILKERISYAFAPNVWDDEAFNKAAAKAAEMKDIRMGLYVLKEAGMAAEQHSSKKINLEHVEKAIVNMTEFSTKNKEELTDAQKTVLDIVKKKPGSKIGDLFKIYQEGGGEQTYKSFQRAIKKLSDNRFISTKKITGGPEGTTTIIELPVKDGQNTLLISKN